MERLTEVLPDVDDVDDDNLVRMIAGIARIYFSGLSSRMLPIKALHAACDAEIENLATVLESADDGIDLGIEPQRLRRIARTRVFLPGKAEWTALTEEEGVPYPVLRLFLLNRRWREVGTVFYKCHFCRSLLADRLDH
nr:hypothetical protein GCM10020093_038280 [Planobispora longispora]